MVTAHRSFDGQHVEPLPARNGRGNHFHKDKTEKGTNREDRGTDLGQVLRKKTMRTAIRAFPVLAVLSPYLARLSVRAVTSNPRILGLMQREKGVRRFGVSILKERPLLSQIHITSYCNQACPMCNLWKNPVMMGYEDAIRILDISAEMGVFMANITGGEPLLHPKVFEIIDYASKLQFFVHLNTNGTVPVEYFKRLAQTELDSISISFHSLKPERYERITGREDRLEKVIRTIDYMRENSDFHIALAYVITSYNSGETEEIMEFAKSKGIPAKILPVMFSPTDRESSTSNYDLLPERSELLEAIEKAIQFKQKEGTTNESFNFYNFCKKAIETGTYKWDCKAGERFFTVSPDCRFGICQDFPTGKKITDKDFIQVWKSESFRKKMDAMRRKCAGCLWNCYLDLEPLQNLFKDPPVDDLLSTINPF